ncbi:hypothetical protein [Paenibacillus sp. GXUN7292]|uniref:hypothetical protein n=1 Tax=Paenibacillus sp. GXUN7292 TaxID=3422499 RepID=UPI003D7E1902
MKKSVVLLLAAVLFLSPLLLQRGEIWVAANSNGGEAEKQHYYLIPRNFTSFGSWTLTGEHLTGRSSSAPGESEGSGGEPAVAVVKIQSAGNYKLWVRDRDYATNQPGTRTFHVGVDGDLVNKTFGTHGQEGFRWTEAGTFNLGSGMHELTLHDTSAYFARCEGFFLTKDLNLVPPEDLEELKQLAEPEDPFAFLPSAAFPDWAKEEVQALESASIENEKVKIVFFRGEGEHGDLVQNEIYIKAEGQWQLVKAKTDELGFLMMSAAHSELAGQLGEFAQFKQSLNVNGTTIHSVVNDFFRSGYPVWFIPSGFEKVSDNQINLSFSNTEAELSVQFAFDDLSYEPKVTLDAHFTENGAYSFMFYNGNETAYEDYETVTAPLLYVKKTVPDQASTIPEAYLLTPMATLHFAAGNERFQGNEMTAGIVMDPSSVPQDFAYPDTSTFGLVLRGPNGDVRPQFTAPMFGTEHSLFEAGDDYSVSYRIIHERDSWYNTFRHISEDLYQVKDLRTNYFHSLNEAIYNATDLMMDDDYGGWDSDSMAHYNMEERDMTTLSNSMSALQRYLLTEDEEILDKRAIPTLAFMLSRQNYHFKKTDSKGGASYSDVLPTPIGGPIEKYPAHVYGGLYEMTQGRMPFLLDYALHHASAKANFSGIADQAMMYKYTADEQYMDKLLVLADQYLSNNPNTGSNREKRFISNFVYGDYIPMVATLMAAYEATGEEKYLAGAQQNAQLLLTGLWMTGYHSNYAETDYTVTQEKTGPRLLRAENSTFWWHGDQQWRLGNIDGEAKSPQELGVPLVTETAPGWLGGRVGMGTEHTVTPGHGNVVTMNNWAGMLSKLSVYADDPFFYTMARNAMIGRFGNYAGYYQDRIIFHQMKENYPYAGPDYTSIYWHHLPVFISMLEDFLINSAWVKSEQHISFPSLYQSGYAYFTSNQYGFAPGTFYNENDMWLWLDRGIVMPDSPGIDYIAARKDGVLGLAFMNEGNAAINTTIKLGEKTDPNYTGTADLYDADGSMSTINIVNGEFTIEIPAKGIQSLLLHQIANVQAPIFANGSYAISNDLEETTAQHDRGKGHVIQVAPDHYYAYVYVSDLSPSTSKLTIHYKLGEQTFIQEKTEYPYEFLIKVDNPATPFEYELTATKNGSLEGLGGGQLKPSAFTNPGIVIENEAVQPEATVEMNSWVQQSGISNGLLKFTVPVEDFFPITPQSSQWNEAFEGKKVSGSLTSEIDGTVKQLRSEIVEVQAGAGSMEGLLTFHIKPTLTVPLAEYADYSIQLSVSVPASHVIENVPNPVAVNFAGMNALNNEIRLVVPRSEFPRDVTEGMLKGMRISGSIINKKNQSVLSLDTLILNNEDRNSDTITIVIEPTQDVPLAEYKRDTYDFDLFVHYPRYWNELPFSSPLDQIVSYGGTGADGLRFVIPQINSPYTLDEISKGALNGFRVSGEIKKKSDGTVLQLDSFIKNAELRPNNGGVTFIIPATSQVARQPFSAADYKITLTILPQLAGAWTVVE